jgi:hypothetical protein
MKDPLRLMGRRTWLQSWLEWGPFWLALLVAAGLLFALARTSPILWGPRPLKGSDPVRTTESSAGPNQTDDASSDEQDDANSEQDDATSADNTQSNDPSN